LQEEVSKKDKAIFEREMKKMQQKEGWDKIQNGLKESGSHFNTAYYEKKEKEKKQKLETIFE